MGKLEGKRTLITGGSSGIGEGLAVAFAREGANVVINYPSEQEKENADAVVETIIAAGCRSLSIQADVSKEAEVEVLVRSAREAMGGIDILVNNAGIAHTASLEEIPVDMWDRVIAVNLKSVFLLTRRILPMMYQQNYGKIINTTSQLAYKGAPGLAHYTATKGAILSFTRSVALEIGNRNVNINCVAPGATHTPILADVDEDLLEAIRQSIPKGRIAEVADILPAYVFLASDESRHFQGQCLSPNGGDVFL